MLLQDKSVWINKLKNNLTKDKKIVKIGGKFVKIREKQKGLSLIEMTIAIAILVVALLSALILATFGLVAGGESQMRVVAINLAREGVEVVRNTRDSNWLAGDDWTNNIIMPDSVPLFNDSANTWQFYATDATGFDKTNPQTIENVASSRVKIHNGLYKQFGMFQPPDVEDTNFYRFLSIVQNSNGLNDQEIQVTCYVVWQERGRWHLVNVEDHLFNWY